MTITNGMNKSDDEYAASESIAVFTISKLRCASSWDWAGADSVVVRSSYSDFFIPFVIITVFLGGLTVYYLWKSVKSRSKQLM